MESLLWLASYPRSGNTFTRILLANYFRGSDDDYDINRLADFIPTDTCGAVWAGFSIPSPATIESVWRIRPDLLTHYRKTGKASAYFGLKTHSANIKISGSPGFDFRPDDRVIYVVRHPLDVLLSFSDFMGRDRDSIIDLMCASGTAIVIEPDTTTLELRGSWAEHTASWLLRPPCPLFLVRYEELCLKPVATLRNMLAFLGAPIDPERVERAAAAASFDRVRDQEASRDFKERPEGTASGTFFRKGTILQWPAELTALQANRLADGCGEIMQRLGYTHPRDVLPDGSNAIGPIDLARQTP